MARGVFELNPLKVAEMRVYGGGQKAVNLNFSNFKICKFAENQMFIIRSG